MDRLTPIQYKRDGLRGLYYTIVRAILEDVRDVSLLNGEEYQRDSFLRSCCEVHRLSSVSESVCVTNRRRALCNLYADYCDPYTYSSMDIEHRKNLYLYAISNHFLDFTDDCAICDEIEKRCQRYFEELEKTAQRYMESEKNRQLVEGCQRYLENLKGRSAIVERQKEVQRRVEEQKAARREYWRKMLYETEGQGLTVVFPDDSKLNRKDAD